MVTSIALPCIDRSTSKRRLRMPRVTRLAEAGDAGFERLFGEQRRAWAKRWAKPTSASRATSTCSWQQDRAVPPDGIGRRSRRSGCRRARIVRPRVPRACLLGHRRLRAAVPRRNASDGGAGDHRVPRAPASSGAPGRAPRGTAALDFRGSRPRWVSTPHRDPHEIRPDTWCRSALLNTRCTSSRTSPGRLAATPTGRATWPFRRDPVIVS